MDGLAAWYPDGAVHATLTRYRNVRQVVSIAVLPALFVLPILLILLWRIAAIHQSEARWQRWDDVINRTHAVHERITDIESVLRGYQLTGDRGFRETFASDRAEIAAALVGLRRSVGQSGLQSKVTQLVSDYGAWLRFAESAVAARAPAAPGAKAPSVVDNSKLDVDIADILSAESKRVSDIVAADDAGIRNEILVALLCATLAVLATGYAVRRTLALVRRQYETEQERLLLAESRHRAEQLAEENQRIRNADQRKGEYVANMSHELRTPLTAMLGFGELLRDGKAGALTQEQAEYLDEIIKSGRHLLDVVGSTLDLAKVEAGKLDVAVSEVDPRNLARDVVFGMRDLAARQAVSLQLDVNGAPPVVRTDPLRFRQILYNFISNAIRFTPAGGVVTVRVAALTETGFRLEVQDSGAGIPESDVSHLFTEFPQIKRDEGMSTYGTGLGLALTRRLAEAQGGTVGYEPAKSGGSVFFATFPGAIKPVREEGFSVALRGA